MKKIKKYPTISTAWVFLFLLCLVIPLLDLFHPGLPVTHDGQDHVARIANFYQSLSEGVIVPRWAGNLNWGYGHPILMFLYPLPSYFASFFHFLSFSFVDSVKLVFGVSFILSGLTMYFWLREEVGEFGGIAGALLYSFAPYRFVDLYVRGAIGEHVAFIFPPLILYFFFKISQRVSYRHIVGGSLSVAGLILSHNAISLMFLPIIFLYIIFIVYRSFTTYKRSIRLFFPYISIVLLGFGLSAFFWIPAFFEGKYTLREIVTTGSVSARFVEWKDFFSGTWSYGGTDFLSKQVGLVQWIMIFSGIIGVFLLKKKEKRQKVFLGGLLLLFFGSLFIMTAQSSYIWQHVSLLSKFQFPWRFLTVAVFFSAVIGGYVLRFVPEKRQSFLILLLICFLFVSTFPFWKAKAFLLRPEYFYYGIYNSTTDTGESSPIWSVRFMEKRPKAHLVVIEGKADITEINRTSVSHTYTVNAAVKTRLAESTLYFPGWNILIDGRELSISNVQFQDPQYRGIMTFIVSEGAHTVEIRFTDTRLRIIANFISLGCLSILVGWLILKKTLWPHFR